jgi:hypothetical protein
MRNDMAATIGALVIMFSPQASLSACCDLVKIEPDPATTRVRVCDPGAASGCTTWLFEGDVASGAPHEVCAVGDSIEYQEFDVASGAYGPTTQARCEEDGDVEL